VLRLEAKAVTKKLDGRGSPVPRLVRGGQHSQAGATDYQERFWREAGLVMPLRQHRRAILLPGTSELAGNLGNVGSELLAKAILPPKMRQRVLRLDNVGLRGTTFFRRRARLTKRTPRH
jgi:hypothetical protein